MTLLPALQSVAVTLLALSVLVLSGCGDDDPTKPPASLPIEIFPLQVGNWWTYEWTLRQEGEIVEIDTVTVRLVEETGTPDSTVFRAVEEPSGAEIWWVRVDGEVRNYLGDPADAVPYLVWLKEPVKRGSEWGFNQGFGEEPTLTARVLSLDASVTIPAGTYGNAVLLSISNVMDAHIVPFVGLVRFRTSGLASPSFEQRLLSYEIALQ